MIAKLRELARIYGTDLWILSQSRKYWTQSIALTKRKRWDMSIDLLSIIVGHKHEDTPCLRVLTNIINRAFQQGETVKSWRKAIISMIPKRRDDGSCTSLIKEMRPISVLQEFGKLASKILADRIGRILLKVPGIPTEAQRAFLRDGSTRQCIGTLVNI